MMTDRRYLCCAESPPVMIKRTYLLGTPPSSSRSSTSWTSSQNRSPVPPPGPPPRPPSGNFAGPPPVLPGPLPALPTGPPPKDPPCLAASSALGRPSCAGWTPFQIHQYSFGDPHWKSNSLKVCCGGKLAACTSTSMFRALGILCL